MNNGYAYSGRKDYSHYVWPVRAGLERLAGKFIKVPGGCFQMGDAFGTGDNNEKSAHEVCVSDFAIGKYEVTQGQWKMIMESNPSRFSNCGDDCPVEQVSWDDVQVFLKRLNSQTGAKFRLPTEAEWEFAARSGGKNEKYSTGNNVDAVAWYQRGAGPWYEVSGAKTLPVGQKQPNDLGIYDMSGNVWEWTADWYDKEYYGKSPRNNPEGPSTGSYRIFRGSGWGLVPRYQPSADRGWTVPDYRSFILGFRLVRPSVL
jgi:formylglycine-generating enzyme required for sulfatase activity